MSDFGFSSWDSKGNPNNYGIRPISVLGIIRLADGQQSGSYPFTVSAGYRVEYVLGYSQAVFRNERRTITLSGNTVVIGASGNLTTGGNIYMANACHLIVYAVKI